MVCFNTIYIRDLKKWMKLNGEILGSTLNSLLTSLKITVLKLDFRTDF